MKKSLASIEAQIAKLQAAAEKIRTTEVAGVINRIRVAIDHYGLTAADLGLGSSGAGREAKGAATKSGTQAGTGVGVAKYRDPSSGKTWTGRGKPPAWIAGAADRNVFLIDRQSVSVAQAESKQDRAAKPGKASKSSKGGVPKYRDASTGKTWTGMGKPPAWIAAAGDRSRFLIGAPSASSATAAAEKAPVPAGAGKASARAGRTVAANRATKASVAKRKARAVKDASASELGTSKPAA